MDVHGPHEPIHTWRDFFLHLITITIGLFIALSLEGCVEWAHHRHLVAEARANIRQEITDNQQELTKDAASLKADEGRLMKNLEQLEEIRKTHSFANRNLSYTLDWSSPSDSAWRSARDTGALSFMDYKKVQNLADVYGEQDIVNTTARNLFVDQPRAISPVMITSDVENASDAELVRMQERSADVLVSVRVLEQVVAQLDQQYRETLSKM